MNLTDIFPYILLAKLNSNYVLLSETKELIDSSQILKLECGYIYALYAQSSKANNYSYSHFKEMSITVLSDLEVSFTDLLKSDYVAKLADSIVVHSVKYISNTKHKISFELEYAFIGKNLDELFDLIEKDIVLFKEKLPHPGYFDKHRINDIAKAFALGIIFNDPERYGYLEFDDEKEC